MTQTTILLCVVLLLSGCCEYKHDPDKQIALYQKCTAGDDHLTADYCMGIAEEGSRIGGCDAKN